MTRLHLTNSLSQDKVEIKVESTRNPTICFTSWAVEVHNICVQTVTFQIWTDFPDCAKDLLVHRVLSDESEGCKSENCEASANLPVTTEQVNYNKDSMCNSECDTGSHSCQRDSSLCQSKNDTATQTDTAVPPSEPSCQVPPCNELSANQSGTIAVDKELPLYERYASVCRTLSDYLEEGGENFLVPEKFFKRFWVMDIVKPCATNSCCFTKRYSVFLVIYVFMLLSVHSVLCKMMMKGN